VQGTLLPLFGNAIVHMTRLFQKDMATVSFTFTSMSFGYLVGSILCGFIYDRVDPELSFVYAHAVVAIFTAIAPFVDNYGGISVFFLIVCIQKIATAYIDAGNGDKV
jgi:MFS family permease